MSKNSANKRLFKKDETSPLYRGSPSIDNCECLVILRILQKYVFKIWSIRQYSGVHCEESDLISKGIETTCAVREGSMRREEKKSCKCCLANEERNTTVGETDENYGEECIRERARQK